MLRKANIISCKFIKLFQKSFHNSRCELISRVEQSFFSGLQTEHEKGNSTSSTDNFGHAQVYMKKPYGWGFNFHYFNTRIWFLSIFRDVNIQHSRGKHFLARAVSKNKILYVFKNVSLSTETCMKIFFSSWISASVMIVTKLPATTGIFCAFPL